MPKYIINAKVTVSCHTVVEAESEEAVDGSGVRQGARRGACGGGLAEDAEDAE